MDEDDVDTGRLRGIDFCEPEAVDGDFGALLTLVQAWHRNRDQAERTIVRTGEAR